MERGIEVLCAGGVRGFVRVVRGELESDYLQEWSVDEPHLRIHEATKVDVCTDGMTQEPTI